MSKDSERSSSGAPGEVDASEGQSGAVNGSENGEGQAGSSGESSDTSGTDGVSGAPARATNLAGSAGFLTSDPAPAGGSAGTPGTLEAAGSETTEGVSGAPASTTNVAGSAGFLTSDPAPAGGSAGTAGARETGGTDAIGGANATGGTHATGGVSTIPDPWEVTTPVVKLDLLLVVDNSQSMADKQQLLAEAVPRLIETLVNPPCMEDGLVVDEPLNAEAACVGGTRRFKPVGDLHLGVITTSLGGRGGAFCTPDYPEGYTTMMEDMSHLVPTVREELALESYQDLGFLAWDNRPEGEREPDASNDEEAFVSAFTTMLASAGTVGCGFEAPLEAWYRFLIDPAPYESIVVDEATMRTTKDGVDQVILDQRAAFLRQDSAVAVLMLNDENDCSIVDTGLGHLVSTFVLGASTFQMRRGTSVCESDPNDPCCISCATSPWPTTCATKVEICPGDEQLSPEQDTSNLRCYEQKRRFGLDLLYPTSRYARGLLAPTVCPDSSFGDGDCSCERANELGRPCDPGEPVTNPLYINPELRAPNIVVLLGILGVPWQDVVTPESLDDPNLATLLSAAELSASVPGQSYSYWDLIVGEPKNYVAPLDPFMVESPDVRVGTHPITGDAIAPVSSALPSANAINGHEWNTSRRDLQYACIYPIAAPIDCAAVPEGENCDCMPTDRQDATSPLDDVHAAQKPLCQASDGTYELTQYSAKAYPCLRQLEVLREYGDNAVVSSVCPKSVDPESPIYGYLPAMDALADRLGSIMEPE